MTLTATIKTQSSVSFGYWNILATTMKTIVFVDYWNLQLTLQQEDAKALNAEPHSHRLKFDWFNLGQTLTANAEQHVGQTLQGVGLEFQEMRVYTSYNPISDGQYKRWITNTLNRRAGIRAFCLARKPKRNRSCPSCHQEISHCNHCNTEIQATQEKGVDTLFVTDLLRLGLDQTYEAAIIVTQDSDMKPAVEHLQFEGYKSDSCRDQTLWGRPKK